MKTSASVCGGLQLLVCISAHLLAVGIHVVLAGIRGIRLLVSEVIQQKKEVQVLLRLNKLC